MNAVATSSTLSIVAHVRRLSRSGAELYVRIDNSDVLRLGLFHGQAAELDLGRICIAGIIKTTGGSPWLAPPPGGSNAAITTSLRGAGFEHGMNCPATVRLSGPKPESMPIARPAPLRAVAHGSHRAALGPDLRIDSKDAVKRVRDYNADFYRGCRNTDLDRGAYERFRDGLSQDLDNLVDQLTFVADRYGGVQQRFLLHDIRTEAALVAAKLSPVLDKWNRIVREARPLIEEIPSDGTIDFLFLPFNCTKQWGVWVSKTLNFSRPDVFPILDSNAKKPLGLTNLGSRSRDYHTFCSRIRQVLLANPESLAAARMEDKGRSPTDVKLLDKILYQLGLDM
jgi:hypothetical protein